MKWSALIVLVLPATSFAGPAEELNAALSREAKVLRLEKAELKETLKRTQDRTRSLRRELENEIQSLSAQLVRLQAENTEAGRRLPSRERLHHAEDQDRQLSQLEDQISRAAQRRGVEAADLPARFDGLLQAMSKSVGLSVQKRAWFDAGGHPQESAVLRVGSVAATTWGPSPQVLLRSAGDTWTTVPLEDVKPIVGADGGSLVDVVLFDPREPPSADRFLTRGWGAWMEAGGLTMWPLLLIGLGALLIGLERLVRLTAARAAVRSFAKGKAAGFGLEEVQAALPRADESISEALEFVQRKLERGLSFLSLAAAVAPLLGLLGTVTGMIGTFSVITEHGTGDPRLLSGGISEALITTQFGLAIAVFALMLQAFLRRWARAHLERVEDEVARRLQSPGDTA